MKKIRCIIEKEGQYYSAYCLELPVATFGSTISEAIKNFEDAFIGYMEQCRLARENRVELIKIRDRWYWLKVLGWEFRWHILRQRCSESLSSKSPELSNIPINIACA